MEEKNNKSCFLHVPNISLVLDCAELSKLSYEVKSMKDEHMINNDEVQLHFHAKTSLETEVMVLTATSSHCIYIVFRGMKGCKTWLSNNFNSTNRYGPSYTNSGNHRVHNVFNEALFKDDLPKRLLNVIHYLKNDEKYCDYHVVITGHNFGAALSILFGIYVAVKQPKLFILVINFGCPKVSSKLFQKDVDELSNIAIWRFVLEDDAVCYYPKGCGDFVHLGFVVQLYGYKSNSEALKNVNRNSEGQDYTITHYINKIETLEQEKLFDVYYEDYVRRTDDGCTNIWQCLMDGVSY